MEEGGAEESVRARAILGMIEGVCMRREAGGPLLRGKEEAEERGVAAECILEVETARQREGG